MQDQFLHVLDRDTAAARFEAVLRLEPLGEELVPLAAALGRVLAREVAAPVDVPSFDRSNLDGFAVRAADTFGAVELSPRRLRLLPESIPTGVAPRGEVGPGCAMSIATGGMLPRGADAIVMIEHADVIDGQVVVRKAVTPGAGVTFAGTDIARGETVLRPGIVLTSRETGVLAAMGLAAAPVWRQPRVAIISTGSELIEPGAAMRPGLVYDSNAQILADAVRELGGVPLQLGVAADDLTELRTRLQAGLQEADLVLLSGGTSKGEGDLSYRAVAELTNPGIVAHGVALKPGKPICLAATGGRAVVVLPGFPTSAVFTFHEFVAPVIRRLAGRSPLERNSLSARLAVQVNSEIGRTEYVLVNLVAGTAGHDAAPNAAAELVAFPLGKGSGSVTTFSQADGYITIGRHEEIVARNAEVQVQLLGRELKLADLVVIGSHCVGLDYLLGRLHARGYSAKFLMVGSTAGLAAAERDECDLAGIHLLDAKTGEYNRPFLTPRLELVRGYGRMQGVVFRHGDARFEGYTAAAAIAGVQDDAACLMVNRNQGSGTRILIDRLLAGKVPPGYALQARSHNAVAAAVSQSRADWGVAIEPVARAAGLGFLPLAAEEYDFVIPVARAERPAVRAFREILAEPAVRKHLATLGFEIARK